MSLHYVDANLFADIFEDRKAVLWNHNLRNQRNRLFRYLNLKTSVGFIESRVSKAFKALFVKNAALK